MPRFVVIEVDENDDLEDQAECIRQVEDLVANGFTSGLEKWARFEVVDTVNHQSIADTKKAILKNDTE